MVDGNRLCECASKEIQNNGGDSAWVTQKKIFELTAMSAPFCDSRLASTNNEKKKKNSNRTEPHT